MNFVRDWAGTLRFSLWRQSAPKNLFFILFTGRTGSSLLASYLRSVPGVFAAGEILNCYMNGRPLYDSPRKALKRIAASLGNSNASFRGAKLGSGELEASGMGIEILRASFPQVKFLVNYRRNFLEQYVSWQLARQTGEWSKTSPASSGPPVSKVRIKESEFLARFSAVKKFYSDIAEAAQSSGWQKQILFIEYGEIAAGPQKTFDGRIFPFLGIPPARVSSSMVKQSRAGQISALVENWEELQPFLSAGNYEIDPQESRT